MKGAGGDVRLEPDLGAFRFVPSYPIGVMQYLSMEVTALDSIEIEYPHMTWVLISYGTPSDAATHRRPLRRDTATQDNRVHLRR